MLCKQWRPIGGENKREGSRTVTGGGVDVDDDDGGSGGERIYACGELKVFRDTRRPVFQALWADQGSLRTSR